jgi:acetyl esterase/lipase
MSASGAWLRHHEAPSYHCSLRARSRKRLRHRIGWTVASLAVIAWATVAAMGSLAVFNALTPKDAGAEVIMTSVPYDAGPRRRLDVYAPRQVTSTLPVIMFIYGGAWSSGDRESYAFAGRALAAQGFVVVIPDYRLVPDVHYPDFLIDCAEVVHWIHANAGQYGGDGERVVLVGHSAGAYNAAMLALDPRWLGTERHIIRGLVTLAGPFDFLPLSDPATIAAFGQWPRLVETQPIAQVGGDVPPTLLLQGAADETVGPYNSENLKQRLEAIGTPVQLTLYPGLGHVGILLALARPFRWLAPILTDVTTFAHRVADPPVSQAKGISNGQTNRRATGVANSSLSR